MIVRCKGSALWCSIIPTAQAIDIDDEKYQTDFDEHLLPRLQRYRFYRKYPKLLPLYHIYDTYKVKFDEWMKYRKKHLKQWKKKDETGV